MEHQVKMAEKKGTETTEFIVGMVFFAVGVLLLVIGIIVIFYFCIYRKRKRQYKKNHLSTTNHSIVYTSGKPDPFTISLPTTKMANESGDIKTVTTLSPLDSPKTIYSLENGNSRGENFMLTNPEDPTLHQPSFDMVDNKHVLREVYVMDKKKTRKDRIKRAFSSQSWDKKWSGSSLFGTKKRKNTKHERVYKTVYNQHGYPKIDGEPVYHYTSNPSLVKAYPASISSLPRGYATSDQRVYVVDRHPLTSQSVILTRSPRSPRSLKFSTASFDGLNDFESDNVFNKTHDSLPHDHVDFDVESNYLRWSPSMKRKLDEKDAATRSNSEITSVSRSGRRRGVEEHKYVYNVGEGTLKQF